MSSPALACLAAGLIACAAPASAALEHLTQGEAIAGLRAALERGAGAAVTSLGRSGGFLDNRRVKIALPDSLARGEQWMRRLGLGRYADELVVAMNRAAEAAVPEARALLVDAVRSMSVQDAKGILTGGDTAGTEYFKRATRSRLHRRFLPIVRAATAKADVARAYSRYAGKGRALGLLDEDEADLDEYVTRKALDGLYLMVAEEEKRIRKDPVGTGVDLLRKVFGPLR